VNGSTTKRSNVSTVVCMLVLAACGGSPSPANDVTVFVVQAACGATTSTAEPNPLTCRHVEPKQFARLVQDSKLHQQHGRQPYEARRARVEEFERRANHAKLRPAPWTPYLAKQIADQVTARARTLLAPNTIAWVLVTTPRWIPEVVDVSDCNQYRALGQACDPIGQQTGRMVRQGDAHVLYLFWRHSDVETVGYRL
jgi:hypothetical protein